MQNARFRLWVALVVALATTFGCLPVMPHPTRVEPAFHAGMNIGASVMSDSSASKGRTISGAPVVDGELSVGLRNATRDDGPGVRLSASGGFSGIAGSLYLELPRPMFGDLDAGVGLFAHRGVFKNLGSYVQLGRVLSTDTDWFVRNAFVLSENRGEKFLVWMPSIGASIDRMNGSITVYLAGAVGQQPPTCSTIGCFEDSHNPQTYLVFGAALARRIQTPRYGELPPRR